MGYFLGWNKGWKRFGHTTIAVVRLLLEEWLERRHGVLTYRLTQVLTGYGCFEGSCVRFELTIRPDVTTMWTARKTRWSIWWRCAPLGRSTAVFSWTRSAAATSRAGPGGGHGVGRPGGVWSRYLLLWNSDASDRGGEALAGAACCWPTPLPPPEETPGTWNVTRRSLTTTGAGLWAASSR